MTNNRQKNSLFLYTALIFVAAIIIIIFAFFAQTHVEMSQPSAPSQTPSDAVSQTDGPQGIAKTAAQLSQDNLELLEENRALNKQINELNEENQSYKYLIEAYSAYKNDEYEKARIFLEDIAYDELNVSAQELYDFISTNIQ